MITRKKLKNLIYNETSKLTGKLYSDDSWEGVNKIKNTIDNIIQENEGGYYCIISVHNGGYQTSKNGISKWKEYCVDIYSDNSDTPVIQGTLNCHAAGTVEDPFKFYDMSLIIWLNHSK